MRSVFRYLYPAVFSLFSASAFAQQEPVSGVDPQIVELYNQASDAINQRDFNKAINIYVQAIRMAPQNIVLRRDLAYAYYLNGQYEQGIQIADEVIKSGIADPQTFHIASALEKANGNDKKSVRLLTDGLKQHPNSGLLHYAKGTQQLSKNNQKEALNDYLKGIQVDPNYTQNYLAAAKQLLFSKEYIWSSIYAEIFVLLEPESQKTHEGKRVLLESIRSMYAAQGIDYIPELKDKSKNKNVTFVEAMENTWIQQFLVMNEQQSVEELIMFRTRVLIDWMSRYPISDHSLLVYHDRLLTQGYFEAYNYFLFGALDDSKVFSNWISTHSKINTDFFNWFKNNPYIPLSSDPKKS